MNGPASQPASYRDVIWRPQFRAIWTAELLSTLGDQAARVALAVLVFHRTGSAALTGFAYALTYLPNLVGAFVLGRFTDRWPYRRTMIGVDLLRAGSAAVMSIPELPTPGILVAYTMLAFLHPLFKGAQGASIRALFDDKPSLGRANAWRQVLINLGALAGFAAGGIISAWSTSTAMMVDAASFVLSAILLLGVSADLRPTDQSPNDTHNDGRGAARTVWQHPQLRSLLITLTVVAVYIGPEALAAPYAASVGSGAIGAGFMFAATPAGALIGALLSSRILDNSSDEKLLFPLAIASGVPLLIFFAQPPLWLAVCAAAMAAVFFVMTLNILLTQIMHVAPNHVRGWVSGVQSTILQVSQGVGVASLGIVASATSTSDAIALGAVVGMAMCLITVTFVTRTRRDAKRLNSGFVVEGAHETPIDLESRRGGDPSHEAYPSIVTQVKRGKDG